MPGFFLDFFLGVLVSPRINNGGFGAWRRVQKPRNHEMLGYGPYNNQIGILLYRSEAETINKAIKSII